MDYHGLIKRLVVPDSWIAPPSLEYGEIRAVAITREHVHDDVAGINASMDLIRRTRGGHWPSEPVTAEFNYVDLVWHECEFRDRGSFTYVVYDTDSRYLGCCYLYPVGIRKPLTEDLMAFDVDVSWWVTPAAYQQGHYTVLYLALRHWLRTEFPFANPYYSNAEIPPDPTH